MSSYAKPRPTIIPPLLIAAAAAAAMLLFAIRLLPGYLQTPSGAGATRPATTIVSSDALSHVPGKRVTTVLVEFPPGSISPEHHHAGSVSVYVLSGTIESQLAGTPPGIYKPGDSFFEPPGAVHLFVRNLSATEPARVLAVFVHDEGAQLTTYH